MLKSGFLLRTHGKTTSLLANLTMKGRRDGSSMVTLLQNGNRPAQICYCGFMGNVSVRVSNGHSSLKLPFLNSQLVRGKALFGMFIFLQLRKKNLCG